MPGPVANDTRQSQDGIVKNGLHRPSLSAIILSSRPLALILIAAPFSSRLSRYTLRREIVVSKGKRFLEGRLWKEYWSIPLVLSS